MVVDGFVRGCFDPTGRPLHEANLVFVISEDILTLFVFQMLYLFNF